MRTIGNILTVFFFFLLFYAIFLFGFIVAAGFTDLFIGKLYGFRLLQSPNFWAIAEFLSVIQALLALIALARKK